MVRRRVAHCALLLVAAALLVGSRAAAAAPPLPATSTTIDVSRWAGRLTVRVWQMPLDDILRAIAERAGVRMKLRGDLTSPVTATFADVPLDEAIERLARGHSVCLFYGEPRGGTETDLTEAWVIANPPMPAAGPVDVRRRAMRLRDVGLMGMRRGADAVARLAAIIAQDADYVVRARAVETLGRFRGAVAARALARALRQDSAVYVRRLAARALGALRTDEARRALLQAGGDRDPQVRHEAALALRRWPARLP